MIENFTFYVDCDGVLRNNLGILLKLYNDNFEPKKSLEDIKDFVVEKTFPVIEPTTGITASHWFFQDHSKEIFLDAEPYPNAKEDIKTLKKYGKVIIVTYQKSYLNKMQTLEWLDKNGIEYDGICFLKEKGIFKGGKGTYFIDDNLWNFTNMECETGILVEAPYNKDADESEIERTSDCGTMLRCKNLHEFVEGFTGAVEKLKNAEKEYGFDKYLINKPLPYTKRSMLGKEKVYAFTPKNMEIEIADFYVKGLTPYVVTKDTQGWGSVSVKISDFENCVVK